MSIMLNVFNFLALLNQIELIKIDDKSQVIDPQSLNNMLADAYRQVHRKVTKEDMIG